MKEGKLRIVKIDRLKNFDDVFRTWSKDEISKHKNL